MNTNINTIRGTKYIQSVDGDYVPVDSPRGIEAQELNRLRSEEKIKASEAEKAKQLEEKEMELQAQMARLKAESERLQALKPKAPSKRSTAKSNKEGAE
jgi:hypothetical protein